jgi:hypothetical protein
MDPLNGFPPLFEVKLELNVTELNYIPSLEPKAKGSFFEIIDGIMNDVLHMTTLIPRVCTESDLPEYLVRSPF